MKSTEIKGYKCTFCMHIYPFTDDGKSYAEECCSCSVKGCKNSPMYTGINSKCEFHKLQETLPCDYRILTNNKRDFYFDLKRYQDLGGNILDLNINIEEINNPIIMDKK